MKRFCLITWGLAILLMALSSCLGAGTAPEAAAVPIRADNAAQLEVIKKGTVQAVYGISWSADSSIILAANETLAIRLDTQSLDALDSYKFEKPAGVFSTAPDGRTVAISHDNLGLYLVDTSTAESAVSMNPGYFIGNVDFAPDSLSLLTSNQDEIAVTIWDATTGKEIGTYTGFETAAPMYAAKYGEDGFHIIWLARGTVQLMDTGDGQFGPVFDHEDFVMDATLSPDGALLATAAAGTIGDEFTPAIYLWDASSGEQSGVLAYPESITCLAFSPDGRLIAAASGSKLTLWDAVDMQLLAELDGHADRITSLAFSPDGASIASASADGTLALWQVVSGK